MIVSNITKRVDIPHEPGEWFEVKKMSWRQREVAADAQTNTMLARMKSLGGDMVKAMRELAAGQEQAPGTKYDRGAVLLCGIVQWSYEAKVTPENIDALDEETAAWAFEQILAMNAPRTEEERKNASSPST